MSYTRRSSVTIAVPYSGSVRYPASQNGGSVSYSGTAYETVDLDITVDTEPFDGSIDRCKHSVDALTGAVVATNAAQCKSIHDNSRKVGKTIIDGFFKTIRSDLTQQINELNAGLEAQLLHLRELSKRCTAQQDQMGVDYERLCKRYLKIFEELDTELENRIFALDEPSFRLKRTAEDIAPGSSADGAVATVGLGGAETARLAAQIEAGVLKQRALESIKEARSLIGRQDADASLIESALMPGAEGTIYEPVVYMEAVSGPGTAYVTMAGEPYKDRTANTLESGMAHCFRGAVLPEQEAETLRSLYLNEVTNNTGSGANAERVRQYMIKLFDISNTKTISRQ